MQPIFSAIREFFAVFLDAVMLIRLYLRPTAAVAAENLFLRKQLGLLAERKVQPRRASAIVRLAECPDRR
jgi:hypothetical protein